MRNFKSHDNKKLEKNGFSSYENATISSNVETVMNYLFDNLAGNKSISIEEINSVIKDSFKLKFFNNNGKEEPIFYYEDYSLDKYSIEVLNRVISDLEIFSDDENISKCIGILNNLVKNEKSKVQEILESKRTKVRLITMPTTDGRSVLDNDVEYNISEVNISGKSMFTKVPYDNGKTELNETSGNSKSMRFETLLELLNHIETTMMTNPNGIAAFKTEGNNGFVCRDTTNFVRIAFDQYRKKDDEIVIIVSGIFKKVSDPANKIFNEYGNRDNIVSSMKKDLNTSIDECENAYLRFKARLIKLKYDRMFGLSKELYESFNKEFLEESRGL